MKNKKVIASINLIGFIFLIWASYIFRQKQSMFDTDKIRIAFMPASYAFSIWILIYILIFLWIIKGFIPTYKEFDMYKKSVIYFFACEILTGISVLVTTKISPIFIIGALITSFLTYRVIAKSDVSKVFKIPFSFLTGWLSVATLVDIGQTLKIIGKANILGIDEITWAIIFLIIGVMIAIIFTIVMKDDIYPLVFIWGYIAIAIENKNNSAIAIMAIGGCIIIFIGLAYNFYNRKINS